MIATGGSTLRAALGLLVAPLLLAGCAAGMVSERPLFEAGGTDRLEPGLWAVLDEDCAAPASADLTRWEPCAVPVWIGENELTAVALQPFRSAYLIAGGTPRIVQRHAEGGGYGPDSGNGRPETDRYDFWVIEAEGPSPFRRIGLWNVGCPEGREMPMSDSGEIRSGSCLAESAAAVREAALAGQGRDKMRRVVWIAPLG